MTVLVVGGGITGLTAAHALGAAVGMPDSYLFLVPEPNVE